MFVPTTSPANLYLEQLAPSSRRVMATSVRTIADALSRGEHTAEDYPWNKATYADAVRLRAWLVRGYSPATVARHLTAWRCVLREAWRTGAMSTDDYLRARDIRAPRAGEPPPRRRLRTASVADLLAVSGSYAWDVRDVAIAAVLSGCGIRRAELAALELDDIDLDSGLLIIRHGKGGRRRELVLPPPLRPCLRAWIALRGTDPGPLFQPLGATGRALGRRLSVEGVAWALRRLAGRAGVGRLSPHELRRWFGTELLARGADLRTVAALLGHATARTTATRYDLRRHHAPPPEADALWAEISPRPRVEVAA